MSYCGLNNRELKTAVTKKLNDIREMKAFQVKELATTRTPLQDMLRGALLLETKDKIIGNCKSTSK